MKTNPSTKHVLSKLPNTSSTTPFSQPNIKPQILNTHFHYLSESKSSLSTTYRESDKIKKIG